MHVCTQARELEREVEYLKNIVSKLDGGFSSAEVEYAKRQDELKLRLDQVNVKQSQPDGNCWFHTSSQRSSTAVQPSVQQCGSAAVSATVQQCSSQCSGAPVAMVACEISHR